MPDITIHMSGELYKSYLRDARRHKRSLEDEVRETILEHMSLRRAPRQRRLRPAAHLIGWRQEAKPLEI